jgi:hypothetical protein
MAGRTSSYYFTWRGTFRAPPKLGGSCLSGDAVRDSLNTFQKNPLNSFMGKSRSATDFVTLAFNDNG